MTQSLLNTEDFSEEIVTELDISHLTIEDDTPVDNFQSEVQQRLLVEPLYSSKALPSPFLAAANVGLFYKLKGDPIVPDVLLSLGVQRAEDLSQRRNRSYFVWEFGKVPEVCIEIVSNSEGDELALSQKSQQKGKEVCKKDVYAHVGVPYYVVFDPLRQIQGKSEMNGALLRVWTLTAGRYSELTPAEGIDAIGQTLWLETIELGLTLWQGAFEESLSRLWLRWCDEQGQVIPTGAERAETERQRAETECQRAETERQRAEAERQRAETERQRANRLAEKLRQLNINPDEV
ncbi:MAG: Uma2 family endonuclease [Leptolyngbyaceae cyanobacterium SL_5_9]|nr:Uma2 family endonuclease [Leptolyngbyaceae cyanobacterium SL_5_9]